MFLSAHTGPSPWRCVSVILAIAAYSFYSIGIYSTGLNSISLNTINLRPIHHFSCCFSPKFLAGP